MIELFYGFLTKIGIRNGYDKILHCLIGFIVGIGLSFLVADTIAAIVGAVLAVGKELYDKYLMGKVFDFFDVFVTLLGTWTGVIVYGFIMAIK